MDARCPAASPPSPFAATATTRSVTPPSRSCARFGTAPPIGISGPACYPMSHRHPVRTAGCDGAYKVINVPVPSRRNLLCAANCALTAERSEPALRAEFQSSTDMTSRGFRPIRQPRGACPVTPSSSTKRRSPDAPLWSITRTNTFHSGRSGADGYPPTVARP
jgi:hypothetical protein